MEAFDGHIRRDTPDGPMTGCFSPDHSPDVLGEFVGFAGLCDISGSKEIEGVVWEMASRRGNVRVSKKAASA